MVGIGEYRRLRGGVEDFKAFLRSAPDLDLEVSRPAGPARIVELDAGE